jgi:hypothetical protein
MEIDSSAAAHLIFDHLELATLAVGSKKLAGLTCFTMLIFFFGHITMFLCTSRPL